jgi:ferric-dicitrate binding protein FerR (iron transport regulator)
LRYPTAFVRGLARTVYLDGEAYFSIEKESGSSFIVVTEDMATKVYGTEFNVSSYRNEKNTSTVLVEGSVGVYKPDRNGSEKSRTIIPGERAKIQAGKILVDPVNVEKYVAWTEGKLLFVEDKFELILKKLERHYNIVIENKIEELNDKRFTGTFTEETVDQIFGIFQEHTPFKYTVKEGTITIYRKV